MTPDTAKAMLGDVVIHTADYRGHTPEELAELALAKIIHVGDKSHPVLIQQANAFKDGIRAILIHYLRMAQESERTTLCGHLIKGGHADLANIIRSI